jgi:hypothetical protein
MDGGFCFGTHKVLLCLIGEWRGFGVTRGVRPNPAEGRLTGLFE